MKKSSGIEKVGRNAWLIATVFLLIISAFKIGTTGFSNITLLQIILFGIFMYALGISINKKGSLWEGTLFLYSFFLFLLSRIFLDFIGIKSMYNSDRFAWYTITPQTTEIILISYIIFLLVYIVLLKFVKKDIFSFDGRHLFKFNNLPLLEQNCETILFVVLPIAIIYAIYIALTQNYLSIYSVTSDGISIIEAIGYIAKFIIPIYFLTLPQRKNKKWIYLLILLYYLGEALQGARNTIVLFCVFILWYFAARGKVIKTRTIIIGGSILVFLCLLIMYMRDGAAYFMSGDSILVKILYSAGGTHMVFANYIDYRSSIPNDICYYFLAGVLHPILRYLINPSIYTSGRNLAMASYSVNLDHKLMYTLAPQSFADGRGFGSNCITEFWAFGGYFGVILIGALFLILFYYVEKKSYKNRIFFLLQFYMIQSAIWAPRSTPLPNFVFVVITIISYFIISAISYKGKVFIK